MGKLLKMKFYVQYDESKLKKNEARYAVHLSYYKNFKFNFKLITHLHFFLQNAHFLRKLQKPGKNWENFNTRAI